MVGKRRYEVQRLILHHCHIPPFWEAYEYIIQSARGFGAIQPGMHQGIVDAIARHRCAGLALDSVGQMPGVQYMGPLLVLHQAILVKISRDNSGHGALPWQTLDHTLELFESYAARETMRAGV